MFIRGHVPASPSVTVEQGIPRLRPVPPKPLLRDGREDGNRGVPFPNDVEHKAAAVLASIAFTTLLAVGLALYLLSRSSRWELPLLRYLFFPELVPSPPAHTQPFDPFLTPLPEPRQPDKKRLVLAYELWHPSEQYMSYLPHSGFHNQRIALENALVLAYILNRTLLVPPICLGEFPIRYRPSTSLRVDLALSSRIGLGHCTHVNNMTPVPEECADLWTHDQISWDWLVNVTSVLRQYNIRTLPREDLTDVFLTRLGITYADTFFFNDTAPYQFRFFDRLEDVTSVGQRYGTRINLPEVAEQAHAHRLLQFGTLFGTARLRLVDKLHVKLRTDVRRAMVFTNPELVQLANAVRDSKALGGEWGYAAVHVRIGDGVFSDDDTPFLNARDVWWRLVRELGMSREDAAKIENLVASGDNSHIVRVIPPPQIQDAAVLRFLHRHPPPRSLTSMSSTCQDALHPLLNIPLYIATDNSGHPAITLFARTFPCVYTLSNFSHVFDVVPASLATAPSSTVQEVVPWSEFRDSSGPPPKLISPFLDALIASRGRVVVGTSGSTFSRFVEDVLWRLNRGWEIVERG